MKRILIILVAAASIAVVSAFGYVRESSSIPISANVTELNRTIGISLDSGELEFGTMPLGSVSRKVIRLSNNANMNSKIIIRIIGDISPYINLSRQTMIFGPFEEKELEVALWASKAGEFSGKLIVEAVTPRNRLMEAVLQWA